MNTFGACDSTAPQAIKGRAAFRWARLAPFFLAGPVSGPLLAGAVFNFRSGRPFVGTLYCVALGLFTLLLPLVAARVVLHLG
jgi:hypothetical protein